MNGLPDLPTPTHEDYGRRASSPALPSHSVFSNFDAAAQIARPIALSPPPTPRSPPPKSAKLSLRLRSNSGLALHTNEDALRQYTGYNPDGSPRGPTFRPLVWQRDTMSSIETVSSKCRRSTGTQRSESISALPIPDFFDKDVFQAVLNNSIAANRLLKFAQSQGCSQNMEYLMRLQEYSRSLSQLTSQISTISTVFTSTSAISPINLPSMTSRALDTDLKHAEESVLPGLNGMFAESKRLVESQVAREVYPDFLKQQLALCTSVSLSIDRKAPDSSNMDFPGLGDAFCLTDPYRTDNPIQFVSEGFLAMTGYEHSDVILRKSGFLQGPLTDRETITRIQDAITRGEESTEIILNYRQDGRPFWNLLFICPLFDGLGKLRFYLEGQINVSEMIGSFVDVLKILNYGSFIDDAREEKADREERRTRRESARKVERGASLRGKESGRSKLSASQRKNFFRPFGRRPCSSIPSPASQHRTDSPRSLSPVEYSMESTLKRRSPVQKLSLLAQVGKQHTAYSRFLVLQHISPWSPDHYISLEADESPSRRRKSSRLNVQFCSCAALEALGLDVATDMIINMDVFTVLTERASSMSVTRSFKSAVQERVLEEGKSVTLDLVMNRNAGLSRRPSAMSLRGWPSECIEGDLPERQAIGSTTWPNGGARTEKFISYWTPLKGDDDEVEWVVLVLAPALT